MSFQDEVNKVFSQTLYKNYNMVINDVLENNKEAELNKKTLENEKNIEEK